MYKSGDKVRLIEDVKLSYHPTEDRSLKKGDIVEIAKIDAEGILYWYKHPITNNDGLGFLYFSEIELLQDIVSTQKCVCESFKLAWSGCTCGYLKSRREQGLE